jgi:succinate dehydrogenase/fumarate reductase flavoprotein subunit
MLTDELNSYLLSSGANLVGFTHLWESRSVHYREDYPWLDDPTWLAWVKVREKDGQITVEKVPIPEKWWPDLTKAYSERYPLR